MINITFFPCILKKKRSRTITNWTQTWNKFDLVLVPVLVSVLDPKFLFRLLFPFWVVSFGSGPSSRFWFEFWIGFYWFSILVQQSWRVSTNGPLNFAIRQKMNATKFFQMFSHCWIPLLKIQIDLNFSKTIFIPSFLKISKIFIWIVFFSRLVSNTFFWLWFWFWLVMEHTIGFAFVPHVMFILVLVLLMSKKSIWISFGFPHEQINLNQFWFWLCLFPQLSGRK